MKRIRFVLVSLIVILAILCAFFFYPRQLENILDIHKNEIYQLKIDYDLLTLSNNNEANPLIVVDDKDIISKIINVFKDYKCIKKYFFVVPKLKTTPYEKIHFGIFYDDTNKVDMLTINDQGEIIIYTNQKGPIAYKIVGNNIKLFDEIKSLLGLTELRPSGN